MARERAFPGTPSELCDVMFQHLSSPTCLEYSESSHDKVNRAKIVAQTPLLRALRTHKLGIHSKSVVCSS
eukprot:528621-Amphidinium_carterae.2